MTEFQKKCYLSTIGSDTVEIAKQYSLGLEMAEFCTAANLDDNRAEWEPICRERMRAAKRFVFHAPFNELCPCAIDPWVRRVAMDRLNQALEMAFSLGIRRMVVHSGFVPVLYYPCWFVEQSVLFWKEFLKDKPSDFEILIENVMDQEPESLLEVVSQVDDARCGLCLDAGHAHAVSKRPVDDWVTVLSPYLRHVHVHDNPGDHDWHMPIGSGTIGWEKLLPRLLNEVPDATYTLENMEYRPAADWLAAHGFIEETNEDDG